MTWISVDHGHMQAGDSSRDEGAATGTKAEPAAVPTEDQMRDEIQRVARTLIRLMEVSHVP